MDEVDTLTREELIEVLVDVGKVIVSKIAKTTNTDRREYLEGLAAQVEAGVLTLRALAEKDPEDFCCRNCGCRCEVG